jgi:hypothetical protein
LSRSSRVGTTTVSSGTRPSENEAARIGDVGVGPSGSSVRGPESWSTTASFAAGFHTGRRRSMLWFGVVIVGWELPGDFHARSTARVSVALHQPASLMPNLLPNLRTDACGGVKLGPGDSVVVVMPVREALAAAERVELAARDGRGPPATPCAGPAAAPSPSPRRVGSRHTARSAERKALGRRDNLSAHKTLRSVTGPRTTTSSSCPPRPTPAS